MPGMQLSALKYFRKFFHQIAAVSAPNHNGQKGQGAHPGIIGGRTVSEPGAKPGQDGEGNQA